MKTLHEPTAGRLVEMENYCGTVSERVARPQVKINDMGRLAQFASGIGDNENAIAELEDLLEAVEGPGTGVTRLEENFVVWSYGLW